MNFNQNDVSKFVALQDVKIPLGMPLMVAFGQERGIVLAEWDNTYVTWEMQRFDDWKYPNFGHYFDVYDNDPQEAFKEAKKDFFDRVASI